MGLGLYDVQNPWEKATKGFEGAAQTTGAMMKKTGSESETYTERGKIPKTAGGAAGAGMMGAMGASALGIGGMGAATAGFLGGGTAAALPSVIPAAGGIAAGGGTAAGAAASGAASTSWLGPWGLAAGAVLGMALYFLS